MARVAGRLKRNLSVTALLLTVLLVASCVNMEVESEFRTDGSADHVAELSVERQVIEQLAQQTGGEVTLFEGFDELEQAAEERGFRVERIETDDRVGTRIIAENIEDNSDLGAVLNNILNTNADVQLEVFSGSYTVDDGEYRLELTIDGQQLSEQFNAQTGGDTAQLPDIGMSSIFDLSYSATMPGTIDREQTNGQVLDDSHVSWDISLDEVQTLTAVSTDEDDGFPWLILIIIGGIVLLLIVGGVVILIALTRRGTSPEPPPTSDEGAATLYPAGNPTATDPASPANPTADQPARELPNDDEQPDRS